MHPVERTLNLADPSCAGFVRQLLQVLDGEEMVVLHPDLERGHRLRISSVADNFQLDVLLAAALLGDPEQGWLPGTSPDPQDEAWGEDEFAASYMP